MHETIGDAQAKWEQMTRECRAGVLRGIPAHAWKHPGNSGGPARIIPSGPVAGETISFGGRTMMATGDVHKRDGVEVWDFLFADAYGTAVLTLRSEGPRD